MTNFSELKGNNKCHEHGYLNKVQMTQMEGGKVRINFLVVTSEKYKGKDDRFVDDRSYHESVIFTDKQDVVDEFERAQAVIEKNNGLTDKKGMEPICISINGRCENNIFTGKDGKERQNTRIRVKDTEYEISNKLQKAEGETMNRIELQGNLGKVEEKVPGFLVMSIAVDKFIPRENEPGKYDKAEEPDWFTIRMNDNKFTHKTFEELKNGTIKPGDLVTVAGQKHNDNYEFKNEQGQTEKRYSTKIDINTLQVNYSKKVKTEEAEAQAQTQPEPAKKAEQPKKAVSNKKRGVSLN